MKKTHIIYCSILLFFSNLATAQRIQPSTKKILYKLEKYQLHNQSAEAIKLLDTGIRSTTANADLAYLYAYQSSIYASMDSLLVAKRFIDRIRPMVHVYEYSYVVGSFAG